MAERAAVVGVEEMSAGEEEISGEGVVAARGEEVVEEGGGDDWRRGGGWRGGGSEHFGMFREKRNTGGAE